MLHPENALATSIYATEEKSAVENKAIILSNENSCGSDFSSVSFL